MLHRSSRRVFLGTSALALLLTACGGGAPAAPTAAPAAAPAATKPPDSPAGAASPTKPAAAGGSTTPAAAPAKPGGKDLVLEMTFPGWISDVNPAVQKLSDEYSQTFGVKINVSKQPD